MKHWKSLLLAVTYSVTAHGSGAPLGVSDSPSIATMHYVMHTERTFAFPLAKVWPAFKDMRRWYTEYTFNVVSGAPYTPDTGLVEGQILKVVTSAPFPREPNAAKASPEPEYFIVETINVLPKQQIVAVVSGSAYDWKRYTVFYVWTMHDHAGKTVVDIDSYGEADLVTPLRKPEYAAYYATFDKEWHRSWATALDNLGAALDGR